MDIMQIWINSQLFYLDESEVSESLSNDSIEYLFVSSTNSHYPCIVLFIYNQS